MFESKEGMIGKESVIKVAAIQTDLVLGDMDANASITISKIKEAAENGAKLIVLPELCNSGYVFNNREEAFAVSEVIPGGPTIIKWESLAKEKNIYIVGGISELEADSLYNAAVLIGPDGFIGKYRKLHLWDREKLWYEPGDQGLPLFNTKIGRIGMMICYDMFFHETWRIFAAKGADIVCCPVNLPKIAVLPDDLETFGPLNAQVAAYDNALSVIVANRVGTERGTVFVGRSMISGVLGIPIDGLASPREEEIKYAELNLMDSRRLHWGEFAAARQDRRVDFYDPLCGAEGKIMSW